MTESIGHKAVKGAIWATIDRFGSMALQFLVNLILARLLLPADFGAIGMLAIFTAVAQVLVDGGFGYALIQKKEPSQKDYSTIFYWNISISIVLYIGLYFCAPFIANFFGLPILSSVLRGIGITILINALLSVQRVRLQKKLAFKILAITNIGSYLIGGLIAILLAYNDFGVWSLVAMQISYGAISITIIAIVTRWHPSMCFSRTSMKELFGFGGYLLMASILQEICKNLQGIIIGKNFSATQMGYYSQAYKLDQVTSYSIPQVIVQVMFPVYATIQDDKRRLIKFIEMNIRVINYIVFPILTLLILEARTLIMFLYGTKWAFSVPYFQVLCCGGFFVCLQNINFYAVAAVGKSRSLFFFSFYKWGFLLLALLIGMKFGMYGILWGMVLSNLNIYLCNAYLVKQHIGLLITSQLNECLKILIICSLIISIIYSIKILISMPPVVSILLFLFLYLFFTRNTLNAKETRQILDKLKIYRSIKLKVDDLKIKIRSHYL